MAITKETYEVKRTFHLAGRRYAPAPDGQPAATIALSEREARYLVLDGAVAKPASNPPQSPVEG